MSDNSIGKHIEFAARALKMPTIRRCWAELAERARAENWSLSRQSLPPWAIDLTSMRQWPQR